MVKSDVKVEMLLEYIKAIDNITYKQAPCDYILEMIRKTCKKATEELEEIK